MQKVYTSLQVEEKTDASLRDQLSTGSGKGSHPESEAFKLVEFNSLMSTGSRDLVPIRETYTKRERTNPMQ